MVKGEAMSEPTDVNLDGLDLQMARRIDEVCRRFEADVREGRQPRIDDYLVDVPDEVRPILRAELSALERELRPSEETVARPEPGPPKAPEPHVRPHPSTIAEAPTIAPRPPPTSPMPDAVPSSIHDEATVPPSNPPRSPHDEPTAAVLRQDPSATPGAPEPTRIRYFGDYEIIREIARGGMGVVFRARQVSLNRTVALKMILAGQLADDTDVKRFYTEAEAAANLDHPGIVPIHEVGQHEGQHYFSMGFVEGQSLSQHLAEGPLPSREAAELIRRVSEAIEYAHQHGVIHRDLKPANILLDQNGNPRVTDFGLAKRVQGDSGLTGSGQIMGTPSYMPPEQAGGPRGDVGPAADVYALGATLYALLTGRPPFQAATAMDTVIQVISDEPVPPRRLNASIPRDLETICLKCLEKEPRRRYGSARALAEDLIRFLSGEPIEARPVGPVERAGKWVRRRPVIAALSASVVVTVLLGLSAVIWQWREAVAARLDAQGQAGVARQQAGIAADNERAARRAAEFANRRLYDVQMNVVQRAWEDWNPTLFLGNLDEQLPQIQKGVDRRGFEWYYWRRKFASAHQTFKEDSALLGVAFSPDGSRIASACSDYTVKVWDVATGQKALNLRGQLASVTGVAFSPDGKRLACASDDGTVRIWDTATGRDSLTFKMHAGAVVNGHFNIVDGMAFSPDGSRVASGVNQAVIVWDAATGHETLTLEGHAGDVTCVAFSPDGSRIASASSNAVAFNPDGSHIVDPNHDATVKVWDLATRRERLSLKGHTGLVNSVAFSRDGSRIASGSHDQTVRVWDAATGHEMITLRGHTAGVNSVAFSRDGSRIASASGDFTSLRGEVKLWDPATGRETLTIKGHTSRVAGVAFSPDGSRVVSAGWDAAVKLWDAATGQEPLTLKGHNTETYGVAFSPDGSRIASASGDGALKLWDVSTGRETFTLKGHLAKAYSVAFSPDGKWIVSAGVDGMLKTRDPATGRETLSLGGTLKLWDAATGRQTLILKGHTDAVTTVVFSPDGSRIASSSWDKTVKLWNTATGHDMLTLNGHSDKVFGVAFSPDGSRLASAGGDSTVRLWDAATGRETLKLTGHTAGVSSVAFSPDGSRLASSSGDSTVKLWDLTSGREPVTIKGHSAAVLSLAFSSFGTRLATAGSDQTVRLWDTATGQETLAFKRHTGAYTHVTFSPDGSRLACTGGILGKSGDVTIWDARPLKDDPANPAPAPR